MSDETAPQSPIKITWLIGIAAAFALFALIGAYSSRMTWDYSDYDQDLAAERKITLAKVQDAESKLLDPLDDNKKPTAEWVDQDKGIIRLPIEEAMAKEVADLKAKAPVAGCEIPGSVPAPAPTAGATNAAPVMGTVLTPATINEPVFNLKKVNATNAAPVKPAAATAKPTP